MPKRLYESSKSRARRIKKIKTEQAAAFLKKAPRDLLLEIFIRLPDTRSAFRTDAVCHDWHSLISENPQFTPRFKSHHRQHQHRYPLHYTIFFRKADNNDEEFAGPENFQPICKLASERWMVAGNLDFLPRPMVIRGSCNDLLLVSPGPRKSTHLYICNPITKQFIELPKIPRRDRRFACGVAGHALICMPDGPNNKFRFKVVELLGPIYPSADSEFPNHTVQNIMVFCSESRNWELRQFRYPRPIFPKRINWLHVVACNGILYWLEFGSFEYNRVIYLDLSNNECGVIDFPDGSYGECSKVYARDQIGVVRVRGVEELRLLQILVSKDTEMTVDLNVWKLSDNKKWVLVHEVVVEMPNKRKFKTLPFVHPTNGDAVFLVWGKRVYECNLKDLYSEWIGQLREPLVFVHRFKEPTHRLLQFPTVHSNWPTQICLT